MSRNRVPKIVLALIAGVTGGGLVLSNWVDLKGVLPPQIAEILSTIGSDPVPQTRRRGATAACRRQR